jgi:hypothetical protein
VSSSSERHELAGAADAAVGVDDGAEAGGIRAEAESAVVHSLGMGAF